MKTYCGVGSRCTPADVLELMKRVATALAMQGWTLRSGHAKGADQAFERGAMGEAEIFLPWQSFNCNVPVRGRSYSPPSIDAVALATQVHPFGQHLSTTNLALHARNSHQILGLELDDPVGFVVCWTINGSLRGVEHNTGGTGQALRLAARDEIEVFNLQRVDHREMVEDWIGVPA